MRILADENIPLVSQFFGEFGDIAYVPGRTMTADDLKDADILLVRSVTQVNEALLSGSSVKMVATATIGTDHVDLDYLKQHQIGFCSAPGCNAQAVVDYVMSALSVLVDSRGMRFQDLTVGIVGVGNVGALLRNRLEQMQVKVLATDPYKQAEDVGELTSLDDVLTADVVTLHTPLSIDDAHPTKHLINADSLTKMKPDACLINSSRGEVVDNQALLEHMLANEEFEAVLDVWEGEPALNPQLLSCCMLATPHIAGYSLDGKMRGTELIYRGVCEFFGLPVRRKLAQFLPEPGIKKLSFSDQVPVNQALRTAIRAAYEIRVDDGVMRSRILRAKNEGQIPKIFDQLRKEYPLRRDTTTLRLGVPAKAQDLTKVLEKAGFDVRNK